MTLTDTDVAAILDRAIAAIDPMLDVLASADPLGLKPRTFSISSPLSCLDRTAGAASRILDVLDWPGTAGWESLSLHDKADWWVSRIGLITSGGAAFPGVFGAWTKKLPASDYLGIASQALVLRAVSREYGVTSPEAGIVMLAAVLFGRDLDGRLSSPTAPELRLPELPPADTGKRDRAFIARLWALGRMLHDLADAVGARPGSPRLLSWLGWIPLIGGPAGYLGEFLALRRAAGLCREWIVAHPDTVSAPRR